MLAIAVKMLTGNRGKYFAIIIALAFTSFVMTQQPATFVGIMARTYSFLTDIGHVDLWVMDPKVQYVDDTKPLQETKLYALLHTSFARHFAELMSRRDLAVKNLLSSCRKQRTAKQR